LALTDNTAAGITNYAFYSGCKSLWRHWTPRCYEIPQNELRQSLHSRLMEIPKYYWITFPWWKLRYNF